MGILIAPMAAGTIASKAVLSGLTHATHRTGISHIAEGLLPMMDRRGTRSYVETSSWGIEGQALLEVRPPLSSFRPANLRLPGDIVEVRALVTCHPKLASEAKAIEQAVESYLHEQGLLFPEVESHEESSWDDQCQVLIRVEHGNIRQLSETIARANETPSDTASRALDELQSIPAHSDTLQAHWSTPLFLTALLSDASPSVFPRLLPGWESHLSQIITGFCETAELKVSEDAIAIHPPQDSLTRFGGYDNLDIWYPTSRTNEGNR